MRVYVSACKDTRSSSLNGRSSATAVAVESVVIIANIAFIRTKTGVWDNLMSLKPVTAIQPQAILSVGANSSPVDAS